MSKKKSKILGPDPKGNKVEDEEGLGIVHYSLHYKKFHSFSLISFFG